MFWLGGLTTMCDVVTTLREVREGPVAPATTPPRSQVLPSQDGTTSGGEALALAVADQQLRLLTADSSGAPSDIEDVQFMPIIYLGAKICCLRFLSLFQH
jgi:hypothetical protein